MNKMFARVVLCVLALSLVSLAAEKTVVTTKPVKGGHAAPVERPTTLTTLFSNFDAVATGIYYCCSGNVIAGPNNVDGESPFNEAAQFNLSAASHIKQLATSVNYIAAGTSTTFQFNIEADASGVPSGTPINKKPYTVTINSQSFGQCCAVEVKGVGLSLAAGTYWVVWGTDSGSDLFGEVNQAIHDQVNPATVAYSASSGVTGSWNAYVTTLPFAIRVRGTTP
jgi:hypothetical protein